MLTGWQPITLLATCLALAQGCSAAGSMGSSKRRAAAGTDDAGAAGAGNNSPDAGTGAGGGGTSGNSVGSAGTSSLGAQPGTFEPNADLDPSAAFVWKESLPGQGTCKPGKYTGTFTCDYKQMGKTDVLTMVSGPVTLTLTKSMSGEFLEVSDGKLDGVAQGIFGFTATLSGKLDCSSLAFTADAVGGVYGFGDPKIFPVGTFMGGLTGTLNTATLVLSGEWSLTENSGGTCIGPWTASYTP